MFYSMVKPRGVNTKRLDSDFYRPEYIAIDKALKGHKTIALGEVGSFFTGPFGSKLPSNLYKKSGIPLFRVGNVGQFEVISDNFAYLESHVHAELSVSEVRPGDLLLVKASVGEKICKVPNWLPKANITQHIIAIRPTEGRDVDYISAFLFSKFGEKQLLRYSLGSIIQYLGVTDAKSVRLLDMDTRAQTYIGDKVRQAERLRAWAKGLVADVDNKINSLQLPINKKPETSTFSSPSLLSDRLDPRPYRSNVVELVEKIKNIKHSKLSSIVQTTSGCPVKSSDFIEGEFEVPLVRIRNIGTKDFIGLDTGVSRSIYADSVNYQAKEGMIVIGMDGYFRAQYFLPEELPMLINQRVAMLSPNTIRSELLVHWLNRPEGQLQLNQWAVKTTVEHTSLSDISKVLIPRLDEDTEERIGDNLSYARYAERLSKRCTELAKLLVESLIEGHISEQELIDAQQALESGNFELDRTLLKRFSVKGIDVDGASPLFDDLDQLYSLLEQAELAQQEA